jgi:uncharacterized protein YebE (UPF0316 family)
VNGFTFALDSVLPLLVFVSELCVVTLSTLRTIAVARGMKYLAPLLGVFEVSIWLFAIGQVMKNLDSPLCAAGFAAGFALGNFLGMVIEEKLAIGNLVIRVISRKDVGELVAALKAAAYGVTRIEGEGVTGPVQMVFTVIKRKQLPGVVAILKRFDPKVFYSVDDIQSAEAGIFPLTRGRARGLLPSFFHLQRAA